MKKYRYQKLQCIQKLESVKTIVQESKEDRWMKLTVQDIELASQNGGEPMEWDSPIKPGYRFLITRYENNVMELNQSEAQYTIKIAIYDTFYNHIITLCCSEIDIAAMMDMVETFIYEFDHESNTSVSIPFQIDMHGNYPEIYLLRDYEHIIDPRSSKTLPGYMDERNQLPRDIRFTIRIFNPLTHVMAAPEIITFYLSDEELCELMYDLYFVALIDLDTGMMNLDHIDLDEDIDRLFLKHLPDNPDYY